MIPQYFIYADSQPCDDSRASEKDFGSTSVLTLKLDNAAKLSENLGSLVLTRALCARFLFL